MNHWQELEKKYYMHTFDRVPLTLVKGKGTRVWDDNGVEYLDFVGGWAANTLGHCHPAVIKAVEKQVKELIHSSNSFYTIPQLQLAEILVQNSCLNRAFFGNSGLEANEGAVKLARRYGKLHLGGAYEIISAYNSFHGRSIATIAASGQAKLQSPFLPMPDGFINVEFNNLEAIKKTASKKTCAVILEPVQGEGGVIVANEKYMRDLRAWCDETSILLILDEIQTGMGRTGTLFAYQQYGIEPDIMTLAKGLAGGLPIGALLAKEKVSVFLPGEHGSTYGGNPVICAAGYAAVKFTIENDIPGKAYKTGQYLVKKLEQLKQKHSFITDIRGRGLLLALEFNADIADSVKKACMDKKLLVNLLKPNALRFIPPLTVSEAEIDEGINILGSVLDEINLETAVAKEAH